MQPQPAGSTALKAAILLAIMLAAASALGQSNETPTIDVAVGYERLHDARNGGDFGPGVFVAIEGTYHEWLAVVGRFDGTTSSRPARFFGDTAAGTGGYFAGAKFSLPRATLATPFVQLLAGIAQLGDHGYAFEALAFQPGVGVDLAVHRHIKLRLAADRRWMAGIQAASGATASVNALSAGLVVH
jgi:hypothetical protein